MKHAVSLGLVLFAVWLVWSGHFDPFLMSLGAGSTLFVLYMAHRMGMIDAEGVPIGLIRGLFLYLPWLVWQIFRSNVDVARRILSPSRPIDPRLLVVRATQREDLYRVIFANSITLTPGTVSVDLQGDRVTVHALSEEAAEELESGRMDRRARALEGGP